MPKENEKSNKRKIEDEILKQHTTGNKSHDIALVTKLRKTNILTLEDITENNGTYLLSPSACKRKFETIGTKFKQESIKALTRTYDILCTEIEQEEHEKNKKNKLEYEKKQKTKKEHNSQKH